MIARIINGGTEIARMSPLKQGVPGQMIEVMLPGDWRAETAVALFSAGNVQCEVPVEYEQVEVPLEVLEDPTQKVTVSFSAQMAHRTWTIYSGTSRPIPIEPSEEPTGKKQKD